MLEQAPCRALAVFHDHSHHVLARFMEPGFRHCFVCVFTDRYWIRIDAQSGMPSIEVVAWEDFDLAAYYRDLDFTVIETKQTGQPPPWPLAVANCVGLVKQVLAINAPLVLTPFQLFKHMGKAK